jgi:hypothetical protein
MLDESSGAGVTSSGMPLPPLPGASGAQKGFFLTVLLPMWRGQLDQLMTAQRGYRHHLIALNCLQQAIGPGGDPLQIAEFCRRWQLPVTAPAIGPVALLRKIGKLAGGWPSAAAVFDPTGAINTGVKVVARLGPLIAKIQMDNALLVALDEKVVSKSDQSQVLAILNAAKTPQALMDAVKRSSDSLRKIWDATVDMAQKLETARIQVGVPEGIQ